jgi:CRP-like cAMP-binding protein
MGTPLRDFFATYPTKRFEKDQVILIQDQKPTGIYMVKLGYVKAYDITPSGSEQIMSYATRGNLFPLGYLFEDNDTTRYFYAASSSCEVYIVPKSDVLNLLMTNTQACLEMCRNLSQAYYHALERLNSVEKPKASEKILHTLKFLEENYGRSGGDVTAHVEVPMKVQDLSSMVGLTRETVGAEIKKLKKAGVVTHRRWQFSINRQKLETLLSHPLQRTILRKPSEEGITKEADAAQKKPVKRPRK